MNIKRVGRWLLYSVGLLIIVIGCLILGLWWSMRASLPLLDGEASLARLTRPVQVERDDLGVPTVRGADRSDIARATGFLHAQDRFFQMDLMRRTAAGELSELLGPGMLEHDRSMRLHRLRNVARQTMKTTRADEARILQAYVEGVNAGLNALGARPPEYLLLRSQPAPWLPEDSVLAALAMFVFLQDENGDEDAAMDLLKTVLPPPAFDFFVPMGTDWDAPVDGTVLPTAPIPSPEQFSFARLVSLAGGTAAPRSIRDDIVVGSNSWAVNCRLSKSGGALVANDMHLALRLPNTWYRMRLVCQPTGQASPTVDVTGVSLPGTPAIIVGSNRSIAWAFTNSMLDTTDLVKLEVRKGKPDAYRTPDGWKPFQEHREVLKIRGGQDKTLLVRSTIWGPVIAAQKDTVSYAVHWVAHLQGAVNFRLLELENIRNVESALSFAPESGIPVQNFVVGDRSGRIGWTVMGRLPRRQGDSGLSPVSWSDGAIAWDGWLAPELYPRYEDPDDGLVWTANNRIAGSPDYMQSGPWITDLGARARQIRDGLRQLKTADPQDMLAIQLDDRAIFLPAGNNFSSPCSARPRWPPGRKPKSCGRPSGTGEAALRPIRPAIVWFAGFAGRFWSWSSSRLRSAVGNWTQGSTIRRPRRNSRSGRCSRPNRLIF